ncbi:hypothetical protein ACHAXH_003509, partial [Discostella pseudostelligera]
SRSTAFPCSGNNYVEGGCEGCGMINNGAEGGEESEVDDDGEYIAANSVSYLEKACQRNAGKRGTLSCDFGACVPSTSAVGRRLQAEPKQPSSSTNGDGNGNRRFQCRMTASYAEGSMWSAIEASDVVYPFGLPPPANNDVNDGIIMDFRLKFGCQTKVTGLFQYQLEDGILGMDHRDGSFWDQLREYYVKENPFASDAGEAKDNANDDIEHGQFFDPSQFSLCYGRQPLFSSLPTATVGS